MYTDDIKVLAKNEKELDTHQQTLRIYNQNMGMEFDIENELCSRNQTPTQI